MNFFIGILKRFPVGVVESGTPIVFTIMAKKYIYFKSLGIFWNAWISHRRRRKINCIQQFFRINVTKSCLNVKPRNMNEVRMTSVVLGGGEEDQVWPTTRCIFRPFRVRVPNSERALIRNGLAYNTKKNVFFLIDHFFGKYFTTDEKYDSHWNKRSIIQFPTGIAAAAAA